MPLQGLGARQSRNPSHEADLGQQVIDSQVSKPEPEKFRNGGMIWLNLEKLVAFRRRLTAFYMIAGFTAGNAVFKGGLASS